MKLKKIKSTVRHNSVSARLVRKNSDKIMRINNSELINLINNDGSIKVQFKKSMRRDNKKRIDLKATIAKYDVIKKKAYLEYPDGRKVYAT